MFRRAGLARVLLVTATQIAWVLSAPAFQRPLTLQLVRQSGDTVNDSATSLEGRLEALRRLEETVPVLIGGGEKVQAARVLNQIGRLQLKLSKPSDALDTYNRALSLNSHAASEVEVDSLNGLASAYLELKRKDEVAGVLQRSQRLSEQSNYIPGQAQALLTLSELQNFDNHTVALTTAQTALGLWLALNDKAGIAHTHALIGRCSMAQSLLVEAAQNYEIALQLWRELNDQSEQAGVLIMLGFIEVRKGEWSSAISYLTQAQGLIDERIEHRKMGQISSALGEAFNENGLPENGLVHFQKALEYYRETQDPRSVRSAMRGIGWTHYLMRNYDLANRYFQETLSAVDPESLDATDSYEYLGRISIETGDYPTALTYFEKALRILIRTQNPKEAAQIRGLIGKVYQLQGNLEQARLNYKQALKTFDGLTDRLNQAVIYYALGRLELKAGDLESAEGLLASSVATTETIRRVPTSSDLTAAFSATVHDRYQAYIDCLMRKHQAQPDHGFAKRAFETSELERARSLAELLRATQTNLASGVDPELAAEEKSLRQSLRIKEDARVALLSRTYKKEELMALENDLSKLETEYKQVLEKIRLRFPAFEQITRPSALTLNQIQENIVHDDQTLLLEYSLGEERSYLWTVSRSGFSSYELPGEAEIEKAALQLYDLLKSNQPLENETFDQRQTRVKSAEGQLPTVIASLSKVLLGPLTDKLGSKRLLIVPDAALQYIPFQVLVDPNQTSSAEISLTAGIGNERPLILDHEIVNQPSASILSLVLGEAANRKQTAGSVAIIADPVFDAADPRVHSPNSTQQTAISNSQKPLEVAVALRDVNVGNQIVRLGASRQEADAIMAVIPSQTGFEAIDFDANRATVMAPSLSQYRIVHFATHALLDDQHPASSSIVLSLVNKNGEAQDGFLRLADIYNLKLPVDLVVLSACQTGLGKDVKGEGLIGLTRGFMYAGASGVVASLWKVDDSATAALMKRFYEGMFKQGLTPAAALRQAQIEISQQKRWRAPYFWAGFVIQGQYAESVNEAAQSEPRKNLVVLAISVAILLLAAILAFRLIRRRRT